MDATKPGVKFWIEAVAGTLAGALALVTVFWKDWIEAVFGVDPDHHSGGLEWAIVVVLAVVAVAFGGLARRTWLRTLGAYPPAVES